MLSLPRPVSSRDRTIMAARRRGLSLAKIALGLGVSTARVEQIVRRYERRNGPVLANTKIRREQSRAPRAAWRCRHCGAVSWGTGVQAGERIYCDHICYGDAQKKLSPSDIQSALDMRASAQTWTGISKVLGTSIQAVQLRIWYHLHQQGLLSRDLVSRIWDPAPGLFCKRGRWNWLIGTTGLKPW